MLINLGHAVKERVGFSRFVAAPMISTERTGFCAEGVFEKAVDHSPLSLRNQSSFPAERMNIHPTPTQNPPGTAELPTHSHA
jgi:hypothetical protein